MASQFVVADGALLEPHVSMGPSSQNVASMENVTFVIAQYATFQGKFTLLPAVADFTVSPSCAVNLGQPIQAVEATILTVTVSMQQSCNGSLSTPALVGIIVGSAVGALILAVAIIGVVLMRRRNARNLQAVRMKVANALVD